MTIDGREELRHFAQLLLGAFLISLDDKAKGSSAALTQPVKDFLESERCATLVDQFMKTLVKSVAAEMTLERRADPFKRLVCHPFTELLVDGSLSRADLPNYFTFLHLVLGDAVDELSRLCRDVLADVRQEPGFSWDLFYQDKRAKEILWTVLVRVAATFKRFEPRRDWFIGLMQNRPHAVSLASNSFVPIARVEGEEQVTFGIPHFNLLFAALFRPLLTLRAAEQAAFIATFGAPPAALVGPLVEKLE